MTQKLSIVMATPEVILTKKRRGMVEPYIEVRAGSLSSNRLNDGLSIFYDAAHWKVPTVGERLLVAVLSGVKSDWLTVDGEGLRTKSLPITYEAVSTMAHSGSNPSRAKQFDTLHFRAGQYPVGGSIRLYVSMKNESGDVAHANVVLSKGQVEGMIAALLTIYPRLEEN